MAVTTEAAAQLLGVSQRQVQRLIASGHLPAERTAGDAWLVDALTLSSFARAHPSRGRPWTAETAWATLWRLSGLTAGWLGTRTDARLRERLPRLDAATVVASARRRASTHRYRAAESFLDDLRDRVVLTGASAMTVADFEMPADITRVDGYCSQATCDALVTRFRLAPDNRGNVTLRGVDLLEDVLLDRREMPIAVIAADLAESHEPRERAAGLRVLRQNLDT